MTFFKQLTVQITTATRNRDKTKQESLHKQLKDEYRLLAHKHHPDKEGGNQTQFVKLQEEYEQLGKMIDSIGMSSTSSEINTSPNHTSDYINPTDIKLGYERTVRKKRAVEPQHIEKVFRVTPKELYDGIVNQELIYTFRQYRPERNIPDVIERKVQVNIHSWQLNQHNEIVFPGHGDQGLLGDKADLILVMRFDEERYSIDYAGWLSDKSKAPVLIEQLVVPTWDTNVVVQLPCGNTQTLEINERTVSATIPNKGLLFKRNNGTQVRGDYKVKLIRHS